MPNPSTAKAGPGLGRHQSPTTVEDIIKKLSVLHPGGRQESHGSIYKRKIPHKQLKCNHKI